MAEVAEIQGAPTLKVMMDAYERRLIVSALDAASWNQRRAAEALGLLPTTLHEKMKRLGLLRRRAATVEQVTANPDRAEAG